MFSVSTNYDHFSLPTTYEVIANLVLMVFNFSFAISGKLRAKPKSQIFTSQLEESKILAGLISLCITFVMWMKL